MIIYLCSLCFLCFFNSATSSELCFDSTCNDSLQPIRFPFRIQNQHPKSCGYPNPGFDLTCNSTTQPLLHLPHSGDFSVQYIDYQNQEIWVNDPNYCLPRKILSLNLSGSPFDFKTSEEIVVTLFNCSWNDQTPYGFGLNPISCLSGSSHTVFASSSTFLNEVLAASCVLMKSVSVADSWPFPPDLKNDLRLVWKKPNCRACESSGGRCEIKPNSTIEIQCKYNTPPQQQRQGMFLLLFFFFLYNNFAKIESTNSKEERHVYYLS